MKVVVCDYDFKNLNPEEEVLSQLEDLEFIGAHSKTKEEVMELTKDADGVLNQWSHLTAEVIENMDNCKVIATYGIGTDKIDIEAATKKGIYVCNVPAYGVREVADHTIAMMMALQRRVVQFDKMIRAGKWYDYVNHPVYRIEGQTIGLIGFGKIPRDIAKKLRTAFGMNVLAYDPFVTAENMADEGVKKVELDELFKTSDVVSIHVPLTKDTKYMIGKETLDLMKPTALVINCGRGAIVHEGDLYEALKEKKIAGAALDVFEVEPVALDSPLLELENVIVTPHSAYFAKESLLALQTGAAEAVYQVLSGGEPINVVNKDLLSR